MPSITSAFRTLREEGITKFVSKSRHYLYTKFKSNYFIYHNFLTTYEKIPGAEQLSPTLLNTDNRKDIDYRIKFLEEVLDENSNYDETMYYYFISDPERWQNEPADKQCQYFINLAKDIKKNGIKKPLLVLKINDDNYQAKVEIDGKKEWSQLTNVTDYQLMQGAHRLAIAIYLGYDTVPVHVFDPTFEIPNYTAYIDKRKDYYQTKIKK